LGGSLVVAGQIVVNPGSIFTQTSGTARAGSMTINSGGTLNLSGGSLTAPVAVAGTLSVSSSSIPINLSGSLALQSTATTLIQRTGNTTAFPTLQESGNMTLAGVLAVNEDFANEAVTTSGQSFITLQTINGGMLNGAFSNIASGQTLVTTDGTASFLVTINPGVDGDVVLSDFQSIPEPGTLLMGISGVALMRWRGKKRNNI
jgi:hypothetical protein